MILPASAGQSFSFPAKVLNLSKMIALGLMEGKTLEFYGGE
jgi:hypothetical protein